VSLPPTGSLGRGAALRRLFFLITQGIFVAEGDAASVSYTKAGIGWSSTEITSLWTLGGGSHTLYPCIRCELEIS
jgi:hypothetical protein